MEQLTLPSKTRLSPRVSSDVVRLAKSKAIQSSITLEYAIEALLIMWVQNKVKISFSEVKDVS